MHKDEVRNNNLKDLFLAKAIYFFLCITLVTFILSFVMYKNIIEGQFKIYSQANGYHSGQFLVTSLDFDYLSKKRKIGGGIDFQGGFFCSHGIIENHSEKFCLKGILLHRPNSLEELRQMVPVGTKINVLYNPEIEETNIAGQSIRVIKFSSTYIQDLKVEILKNCYYYIGPSILSFIFLITLIIIEMIVLRKRSYIN